MSRYWLQCGWGIAAVIFLVACSKLNNKDTTPIAADVPITYVPITVVATAAPIGHSNADIQARGISYIYTWRS
jgi:hypothetical protein